VEEPSTDEDAGHRTRLVLAGGEGLAMTLVRITTTTVTRPVLDPPVRARVLR
jgi:hypothetical protein